MMDIIFFISFLVIGVITGWFGAVIGSALLVTVPALILFGLPAHTALGTGKFSILFRELIALRIYHKNKVVSYSIALPFTILGIMGTIMGANFTLTLNEDTLKAIIYSFMIIVGVVLLFNHNLGMKKRIVSSRKIIILGSIFGLVAGFYAGVYGGGLNLFMIFTFVLLGQDFLGAVGTSKFPNLLFIIIFVIIFAFNKKIDYIASLPLVIGTVIGTYFGSKHAIKKGNKFIKGLFVIVVFAMAIKLLFF